MKRKIIVIIFMISVAISCIVAYQLWNKPHSDIEKEGSTAVTATALTHAYSTNEADADKRFLGKVLEVSGTTAAVRNEGGSVSVTLHGTGDEATVQCTMRDKDVKIDNGKALTIKGRCVGNTMFDVVLTECVLK